MNYPTFLYIKQHAKSGMLYFGKTVETKKKIRDARMAALNRNAN